MHQLAEYGIRWFHFFTIWSLPVWLNSVSLGWPQEVELASGHTRLSHSHPCSRLELGCGTKASNPAINIENTEWTRFPFIPTPHPEGDDLSSYHHCWLEVSLIINLERPSVQANPCLGSLSLVRIGPLKSWWYSSSHSFLCVLLLLSSTVWKKWLYRKEPFYSYTQVCRAPGQSQAKPQLFV